MRTLFCLFLCCCFSVLSAQMISFEFQKEPVGSTNTAQLKLKLSREYTFMIPGAGKPIGKLETMEVVLLTDIQVERINRKGFPVTLILRPKILGGTLNGRRIDPASLQGRVIRAELESYPCTFTSTDGKELSGEAKMVLAAFFRQQQGFSYADILGKSRNYKQGGKWLPDSSPILQTLAKRNISLKKRNLTASAMFENKFKVNGIECTAVVLNLLSVGTHAYDFRIRTRIVLPVDRKNGNVFHLTREGVEVVDRKLLSGDFAAAGSAVRITTKEQMEVTYVPRKKQAPGKKTGHFMDIF